MHLFFQFTATSKTSGSDASGNQSVPVNLWTLCELQDYEFEEGKSISSLEIENNVLRSATPKKKVSAKEFYMFYYLVKIMAFRDSNKYSSFLQKL